MPPTMCQASGQHRPRRKGEGKARPKRVGGWPKVTHVARLVPRLPCPDLVLGITRPGVAVSRQPAHPLPACPPALPGNHPPSGQTWSKQGPQGPRPFYMSIYCPKWGGASCPGLKGPEPGRQPAQWEVCSQEQGWGGPGDPIRPLTPGWGQGPPRTHTPSAVTGQEAQSQMKAGFQEEALAIHEWGGGNELPVTRGKQDPPLQNPITATPP